MKTNEEGHVWLEKSQAYICPSYLNKTCTDFSDINSEWLYNLYQKHFPNAESNAIKYLYNFICFGVNEFLFLYHL